MNERLTILDELPQGFFELDVKHICSLFPTPTLIQLKGEKTDPLFVSILLHGNEYSGLRVMQRLLIKYVDLLPRSLNLFIGNVAAAQEGLRVLIGQTDYNRCWPGTEMVPNAATEMMQQVVDHVIQDDLFAAVDLHNNSGANPHYAGITDVTQSNQHLVSFFNHIGLVFSRPKGVSTMAFNGICPAATLECGKPGDLTGIEHALELVDSLLHMDHFPDKPVAAHDLQLVESIVTLNIPDDVSFDFNLSTQADLTFDSDFDHKNFTEIEPTDVFAYTRVSRPLTITDQKGFDVTDEIMRIEEGKVFFNKTFMPAMISMDKYIVRQDCLCYLLTDYQH